MDLVEILNNILFTKNKIRDILGENNNIARYSVSIHNLLAKKYNEAYRLGFHGRYYDLTGVERWVEGPQEYLEYDVNPKYYDAFTTEILTDIMRDVLNYRLNMKDEMNEYIEPDIDDQFKYYPDYLLGILEEVSQIGANDGIEAADEAYDGNDDVETPTFTYSDNRFTITSSQSEAIIWYSIGEDGVPFIYTGPTIISESADVYYWARLGRSESAHTYYSCTVTSGGNAAFVWPPTIVQQDTAIYLSCSTNGASMTYSIDSGQWQLYTGPIMVNNTMNEIKAVACANNEWSKYAVQPILFGADLDNLRPANVRCTIVDNGTYRTVTLTCETANAVIYYCIDEADGFYRTYSAPFTVELNHFLVYTYARKEGYESPQRLVYKWDIQEDDTVPADVQFQDEGSSVTLFTTTSGARINYRFGPVGSYGQSSTNAISVSPSEKTDIYAFATLNGVQSKNETMYTFTPRGWTQKPPEPTMYQDGNTIIIVSNYEVRYTTNGLDPRSSGAIYNKATGITITEFTTVKAAAINNNMWSNVATASFAYDDSSSGGESGSQGGGSQGGNDNPGGNGGDTGEPFVGYESMFAVTGATGLSFNGSNVKFGTEGDNTWKEATTTSISGLNSSLKTYIQGNITRIYGFTGSATVSGDLSSINASGNYSNMFNGCSNLVNASGLRVGNASMFTSMFQGCTSLREAAFEISASEIPANGMQDMFNGCISLIGSPTYSISSVGNNGMQRAFRGTKISSTGTLNLSSAGTYAFSSCFENCTSLTTISLTSPSGTAPNNVFDHMFYGCSGLNDISSVNIRYETMGSSSCQYMFYGTSSLRNANGLYAVTMGASCYAHMFENSGLQNAPVIGATTLAESCFDSMFRGCTNLGSSPDLMVKTLSSTTRNCYRQMFYGCSRLSHIKAMFINNPTSGGNLYTENWVYGVAQSGAFEYNPEATWATTVTRGPHTIPVGWNIAEGAVVGTITSIQLKSGFVYITASNNDDILYATSNSSTVPSESAFTEYTGPFQINTTVWVHARCMNSDGVLGRIASQQLELNAQTYPDIRIIYRSGYVMIDGGGDFEYDSYSYQLIDLNTEQEIKTWTAYSGRFTIDRDVIINVRAYIGGVLRKEGTTTIYYNISSPVIRFITQYNDPTYISVRCNVSYPNTSLLNKLYYKLNDTAADNPDTQPSKWTEVQNDTDFLVARYPDYQNDRITVSAIAQVNANGELVWSPMNSLEWHKGSTEQLYPVYFVQVEGTNNVNLQYNGDIIPNWTDTDVVIDYKIDSIVRQYTNTFNLSDYICGEERDYTIKGRARCGNDWTDWYDSTVHFNPAYVQLDIYDPTIDVQKADNSNDIYIYITNSTPVDPRYTLTNYFRIEVIEYDATGSRPTGGPFDGYYQYQQPFRLDYHIDHVVKFKVWAYAVVMISTGVSQQTEPISTIEYDIKKFGIMWDERPNPTIEVRTSDFYVTVTCPFAVTPMIKITDTTWGPGSTNEHKYDEYKPATGVYDLGELSPGVWGGYLDEHLATGIIYAKYQYEGIWSGEASKAYNNTTVQPLMAPTISVGWDSNKQAYIIQLTCPNDGVQLQYKIENCVWGGGVVDEHKYDDWKVCGYYGDSLSQWLIEGDIIARTVYDPHDTNQTRESEYYHFVNTHYQSLSAPQIFLVEKSNNDAIKVMNNNPLATNYWRCQDGAWNPNATNTHKYDTWMIAFGTDNDLDTNLLSGTIEAYSVFGHESTLYNIVTFNYDSGITIDDTPPTITVEPNNDEIYNVTITNNADMVNFYNIIWKVDDLEWSDVPDQSNMASRYQGTTNGYWKLQNMASAYTFTIGKDLASGTIMAFASNAANTLHFERTNNTPITTYNFTNALI